jgi:hypothetical protein
MLCDVCCVVLCVCAVQGPRLIEIPRNFYEGLQCLFDAQSNKHFVCPTNANQTMFVYNILTFCRYLTTLILLKFGGSSSSVLVFLSASLSLPLTNLCFQSSWLMGSFAESPKHAQYLCSALAFVGLLCYAYAERTKLLHDSQMAKAMALAAEPQDADGAEAEAAAEEPLVKQKQPIKNASKSNTKAPQTSTFLSNSERRSQPSNEPSSASSSTSTSASTSAPASAADAAVAALAAVVTATDLMETDALDTAALQPQPPTAVPSTTSPAPPTTTQSVPSTAISIPPPSTASSAAPAPPNASNAPASSAAQPDLLTADH